jgi:DNA-directed RNA polymerase subunit RPC12/RpoP
LTAAFGYPKINGMPNAETVQCPKCGAFGTPVAVRTQLGKIIINYRCAHCQLDWEKIRPEAKAG